MTKFWLTFVRRSHSVLGRVTLSEGMDDVAVSLGELPVFFSAKEGTIPISICS